MPAPGLIEGRPMNLTDSAVAPNRSLQAGSTEPTSLEHPSPSYVR